jgi:Tol biopolymer transport system component
MTVKRSIIGFLVVLGCLLIVPRGFSATSGDISTYLPLIRQAFQGYILPDENLLLYQAYNRAMTGSDFALVATAPTEIFPLTFDAISEQPYQRLEVGTESFSPDGTRIAFYKFPSADIAQLWVMNANGGLPRLLLQGAAISDAAWGPDSETLLYTTYDNARNTTTLNTLNINTSISVVVASDITSYRWDTTQMRIYYTADREGLMGVNADGTERTQLFDPAPLGITSITAVLPDGRLVFPMGTIDGSDLYVIGGDGNNLVRLTNDVFGEGLPRVSPDGSKVFYSLGDDSVHIVSITGEPLWDYQFTCVSNEACSRSLYHSWSPDGTELAFTWFYIRDGNVNNTEYALYRVAADGSQAIPTIVSQGTNRLRSSAYSPDGRYFAYVGEDETAPKIYVLDRTTNTTEVLVEADTSLFVWSWRP